MKKILVPLDFSPAANNAVEYAARMAEVIEASVTLMHIQQVPNISLDMMKSEMAEEIVAEEDEVISKLIGYCHEVKTNFDITCSYKLDHGNLDENVPKIADKENYDLIILGTSGEDSLFDYFFGTNSYRILKKAEKPVLIIPPTVSYNNIKIVVYASNYQESDADSILFLQELFREYQAEYHILHVSKGGTESSKDDFYVFEDIMRDKINDSEKAVFERVVNEDVPEALDEYMNKKESDLLAVSTKHRNLFQNMVHKSVTREILLRADYPVMVMHEK